MIKNNVNWIEYNKATKQVFPDIRSKIEEGISVSDESINLETELLDYPPHIFVYLSFFGSFQYKEIQKKKGDASKIVKDAVNTHNRSVGEELILKTLHGYYFRKGIIGAKFIPSNDKTRFQDYVLFLNRKFYKRESEKQIISGESDNLLENLNNIYSKRETVFVDTFRNPDRLQIDVSVFGDALDYDEGVSFRKNNFEAEKLIKELADSHGLAVKKGIYLPESMVGKESPIKNVFKTIIPEKHHFTRTIISFDYI